MPVGQTRRHPTRGIRRDAPEISADRFRFPGEWLRRIHDVERPALVPVMDDGSILSQSWSAGESTPAPRARSIGRPRIVKLSN